MAVRVLLFAHLRRQAEQPEFDVQLSEGASVRDLAAQLSEKGLDLTGCMAAVNETYATPDTALSDGDEVAFLPPVAGGSGGSEGLMQARVTAEPLSLSDAERFVVRPQFGAQSYFVGTVRSPNRGQTVTLIEYEAYASMAEKVLRDAAAQAQTRFAGEGEELAVYLAHRTGRLQPAEASILIGVGSPHRRAALEACDWLIEHVKAVIPVWKLEELEDGQRWVEGVRPAEVL
ncbi:molybdopterin converting factor subunit 1 [Deinococcus radiophilus]|uniref:Molybdopterin converting factor subunit 1 n=1 Tax=Deinococcus radiophilus TaxID=32062 RepID=A0A3S0KGD1_9DEIO|nr:molybdopterin converting factor subunit 1 [Deinococcus radiophilus]RTR26135.1 molybdopterin converting factor subunit 1 [Deinococcus radiophilus]UFA51709.1 molybdopterin converting factor subunit 1 [Deinococcus radiophilus]